MAEVPNKCIGMPAQAVHHWPYARMTRVLTNYLCCFFLFCFVGAIILAVLQDLLCEMLQSTVSEQTVQTLQTPRHRPPKKSQQVGKPFCVRWSSQQCLHKWRRLRSIGPQTRIYKLGSPSVRHAPIDSVCTGPADSAVLAIQEESTSWEALLCQMVQSTVSAQVAQTPRHRPLPH